MITENPHLDPEKAKEALINIYPTKVARKRAQQIVVNQIDADGNVPEIKVNTRTVPGIITQRGCTYAGCKGVVLGPTRDIVIITHGPIGCGYYSWLTRRNQTDAGKDGENFKSPEARRIRGPGAITTDRTGRHLRGVLAPSLLIGQADT